MKKWDVWIGWVLANLIGGVLAEAAIGLLTSALFAWMIFGVSGALIWGLLGIAQYLVLRRGVLPQGPRTGGAWVLASAAGGGLGMIAGVILTLSWSRLVSGIVPSYTEVYGFTSLVVVGLVAGFCVGLAQWFVLGYSVEGAGYWVWVHSLALCAGFIASYIAAGWGAGGQLLLIDLAVTGLAGSVYGALWGGLSITVTAALTGVVVLRLTPRRAHTI